MTVEFRLSSKMVPQLAHDLDDDLFDVPQNGHCLFSFFTTRVAGMRSGFHIFGKI